MPGATEVRLAPVRFQSIHFLYLAVAVAFPAGVHFFGAPDFLEGMTHPRARLVFSAFLYGVFAGVPFLMLAVPTARSLSTRFRLVFDGAGLTVRRTWLLGRSRWTLSPGEIEKVDLTTSSRRYSEAGLREGSVVRIIGGGGRVVEIGSLLECDEARWLRDEISRRAGV